MRLRATLLLVALALAGFSPARCNQRRNLLLITIDTLRADHLSCNGSQKVRTPNLDRLAREGVNFTRARSPVPLTLPAHASILTGNYPPTHSVRSNGEYQLPDEQISLAEVLSDRGFQTAAFVSSFVLDRRFGIGQGFEHYDDRVWAEVEEIERLDAERTAGEVFVVLDEWLRAEGGSGPLFVWAHLYDPHAPYAPPEPFRTEYARDPYAGEVAYTDHVVGLILRELEAAGRLRSTLIAVVGDHGEGLGDHGERTHSLLIYNSTLHVPMIIWGPGEVPAGPQIDELVRIIDLAPTLLDYLGIEAGLGQGISLRPLIESGEIDAPDLPDLTAYSESFYPELALGWSPLRGLESGEHRLILAPTSELFHIGEDPRESRNLVASEPAAYQRMKRQLADSMRAFDEQAGTASAASLDPETRDRLQSLGYLSGSGTAAARRGPPVDPKEGIELWNRIQLGIAQMGQTDYRSATETFETVLLEDPDIPLVYEYLGSCWQKLSELDKAEKVYRQALDRGIESPRVHHELGRILAQKGRGKSAEQELQIALALDPQSVVAHYDLGNVYRASGRLDKAAKHYREALAINQAYLWGWNGLAMTLAAQGENQQALDAFRRVVEIDPMGPRGFFNLAVHLERLGLVEEAATTYRRFLELWVEGGLDVQRRQAQAALERLSP